MFDKYEKVDQGIFGMLLGNIRVNASVVLNGTPKGFELYLKQGDRVYKLYTQRKKERIFRSANTAFTFLSGYGVSDIQVRQLDKVK